MPGWGDDDEEEKGSAPEAKAPEDAKVLLGAVAHLQPSDLHPVSALFSKPWH